MNMILKKCVSFGMLKLVISLFVLMGLHIAVIAQNVKFSSAYTNLTSDCKLDGKRGDYSEGQDFLYVCRGLDGYKVRSSSSAFFDSFRLTKGDTTINLDRDRVGVWPKTIEWRLANGKPFAVIIRFNEYAAEFGDDGMPVKTGQNLRIIGLAGYEHIDFKVDVRTPNANANAREMADFNRIKK